MNIQNIVLLQSSKYVIKLAVACLFDVLFLTFDDVNTVTINKCMKFLLHMPEKARHLSVFEMCPKAPGYKESIGTLCT